MNEPLREATEQIVLKLLGHDDNVAFGNGYHDECKQEADEATDQIMQLLRTTLTDLQAEMPTYRDNTDSNELKPQYDDYISVGFNEAVQQQQAAFKKVLEEMK